MTDGFTRPAEKSFSRPCRAGLPDARRTARAARTAHLQIRKEGRNGKPVTLIEGFEGGEEELKNNSKKIKTTLGIGGSEKDGVIIIQGDSRDKIMKILSDMGYKTKRVGG